MFFSTTNLCWGFANFQLNSPVVDKVPGLSIRVVFCILQSDTDTSGHPRKNFLSEFAQNCPNCPDLPRTAHKSPKLPRIAQNAQNCPKCPELPRLVFRYVLLKHSERKFFLGRPVRQHCPDSFKIVNTVSILSGRFQFCLNDFNTVGAVSILSGRF